MASTGDLPNSHVPSRNPGYHTSQKTSAKSAKGQSRLKRVKRTAHEGIKAKLSPLSSAAAAMNAIQTSLGLRSSMKIEERRRVVGDPIWCSETEQALRVVKAGFQFSASRESRRRQEQHILDHQSRLFRHQPTHVMPSHYSVDTHTFNLRYLTHAAFLSPIFPVPSQHNQHPISPSSGQSSRHVSLTNTGSSQKKCGNRHRRTGTWAFQRPSSSTRSVQSNSDLPCPIGRYTSYFLCNQES